jgi:hypothetical protein
MPPQIKKPQLLPCQIPGNQHHNGQIRAGTEQPFTRTPQGKVKVIPQPVAQGHMPASPEIGQAGGEIGRIKVLGQINAHQHGAAPSNIDIGAEVDVEL